MVVLGPRRPRWWRLSSGEGQVAVKATAKTAAAAAAATTTTLVVSTRDWRIHETPRPVELGRRPEFVTQTRNSNVEYRTQYDHKN